MRVEITLRDTRTGYTKTIIDEYPDMDLADWMWNQGDYSYDDNRSLFLYNGDPNKELERNLDKNIIELLRLQEGQ